MSEPKKEFYYTDRNQPHPARAKAMLQSFPQIKSLFGAEPKTMIIILQIVISQTIMAIFLGMAGLEYWWLSAIAAYCFGAFFNHASFVIIHETSHNAVFNKKILNRFAACIVDLINVFPSAEGFRVYHIRHHAHQGDYEFDADLPYKHEAKTIGNNPIFKMIWLLFFPVVQGLRPFRLKNIKMWNPWVVLNVITTFGFAWLLGYVFGWNGILYLFLSFAFSIGLHPLGARWIQEHYTPEGNPQESFNYEGPLNLVSLNVGLHNEHHDFPSIPWNKLPELRKIAPDYYLKLDHHTSWVKLFFNFIFNPKYDLFSRIVRNKEGRYGVDKDFMERNELVLSKEAVEVG
ncbi:MAG: fatty acid desaturase [Chitinophagales bacterium]|nr:fatty acid desaturase [Chitinophagales bacterium]